MPALAHVMGLILFAAMIGVAWEGLRQALEAMRSAQTKCYVYRKADVML